jgi:D-arabinose 1-dehydrogenase-like Zn-dependent alcohol dehydrogenase
MILVVGIVYLAVKVQQNVVEELVKLGGAKVILATLPSGKAMSAALGGLSVNGKLIMIGASNDTVEAPPLLLISGRRSIVGWPSGTSIDSQDTLNFSVLSDVRSMNEVFPLERAPEAYELMMSGKVRFRAVLTTGQ